MKLIKWLIELVLPSIIGVVVHKLEKLSKPEMQAQEAFISGLEMFRRRTRKPIAIALIGLVGSGKSSVAKTLSGLIGATVISGDQIRIELRKQGARFEKARLIAENAMREVVRRGGNAILDSDFIDPAKRASLRKIARDLDIEVHFVCVYTELDVMLGRIMSKTNTDGTEFFDTSTSSWTGEGVGKVVKIRELVRRLPHHYKWTSKGGGTWSIKNPPCKVLADVDTTDPESWKIEVEKVSRKLLQA